MRRAAEQKRFEKIRESKIWLPTTISLCEMTMILMLNKTELKGKMKKKNQKKIIFNRQQYF